MSARGRAWGKLLWATAPFAPGQQATAPVELKLLVGNLRSGKIGTLTIPLTELPGRRGAELRFRGPEFRAA